MTNEEKIRKKSHARIGYNTRPSHKPNPTPDPNIDRDRWIETVSSKFVSPSKANRRYYKVIWETLWPKGHGIPGPIVSKEDISESLRKEGTPPAFERIQLNRLLVFVSKAIYHRLSLISNAYLHKAIRELSWLVVSVPAGMQV